MHRKVLLHSYLKRYKKYIIKQASRLETAAKAMSESRNGEVLSRAEEIISRVKQLYRYIGEDYDNSITDL